MATSGSALKLKWINYLYLLPLTIAIIVYKNCNSMDSTIIGNFASHWETGVKNLSDLQGSVTWQWSHTEARSEFGVFFF